MHEAAVERDWNEVIRLQGLAAELERHAMRATMQRW